MRLIDADALMESIDSLPMSPLTQEIFKGRVVCAIQDAPTVGGWISVKDRLPEMGAEVLVYGKSGGTPIIAICWREINWTKKAGWNDECGGWGDDVITHWMPLPEPPEDETEEESCG